MEEVIAKYGKHGVAERTDEKLPLDLIPNWASAYTYSKASVPVILTALDTASLYQDNWHGGNLAFYKDGLGVIQSVLLAWQADSLSPYTSNKAPLDSTSLFNGMMMIDDQDTLRKVARLLHGKIVKAKGGATAVQDISLDGLVVGGAQNRCCWQPRQRNWWNVFWREVGELLEDIGNFFAGQQIWDDVTGPNIYYGAGSFFFDSGFILNTSNYSPPGGVGMFEQQFAAQMSTCTTIREYIESIGGTPPGYGQGKRIKIDEKMNAEATFPAKTICDEKYAKSAGQSAGSLWLCRRPSN
ncbi:MAG: hypothetical protein KIS77_11015 [Saprospiraceae bacterium]|nr:hypothetical protein [Saprospiraceae bacterium]